MDERISKCWQCAAGIVDDISFCGACFAVQKPLPLNHFARLRLDINFEIDYKALTDNYFTIQQQFHPDRFVNKSQYEKMLASEHSVAVNEAYNTLKSPVARAGYLLILAGINIEDGSDAIKPDMELLETVMINREKLSDIESQTMLDLFETEILEENTKAIESYSFNYQKSDIDNATHDYIKLRYLSKLLEEIKVKKRWLA